MRRVSLFLLTAFLTTVAGLNAEEIRLDVDTSVTLALKNNLDLEISRIDLLTKERIDKNSWNEFLPSVSLGTGLTRSGTASFSTSPWDLAASVTASLPLSASSVHRMRSKRLSYELEKIDLETAGKTLVRDVKKGFYNLIILSEKRKLIEQNIETAQKRYYQAKTNYENGLVSELTMLGSLVTLENLRPDLDDATVSYRIAAMEFSQLLGLERDTSFSIRGTIEQPALVLEAPELIHKHFETRLDIQGLLKEIESLKVEKMLAGAEEYTPTLSLSYSYRKGINDPFSADWSSPGNWSDRHTVGISLSFPVDGLIPGSSSDIALKQIDDELRKTQIELLKTRRLAGLEIEAIILQLDKSAHALDGLEKNVLLAQKTYDLTERQYNAGTVELLAVEEANDTLQEAKLNVLEERYNYLAGLFDLEFSLNTAFETNR